MAASLGTTAPIRAYNRRTGQLEEELVYRRGFMDFMYGSRLGLRLTRTIFKRRLFTKLYTLDRRSPRSSRVIQGFIERYALDPGEFAQPVDSYRSFNDFFRRRLKPDARPLDADPDRLIAPADGKLLALPIEAGVVLPVKGQRFALADLVGSAELARPFLGGQCLIFRLCPPDYHRFCFVDDGVYGPVRRLGGSHYSVSILAQRLGLPIFTENHRTLCLLHSQRFDTMLQMEVGSFSVGKIILHNRSGGRCARGQEKGWFEFGASTVILLVRPGVLRVDEDIRHQSAQQIETLVRMGEGLGTRVQPGESP